jgi:DNA-binding TFAR19-related protein (PDSD5 family)
MNNNDQNQDPEKIAEQVLALEKIAKTAMTKEAVSRYGNLKMAHTELAIKAIAIIAQAIQTNQIKEKITDEQFKELLKDINQKKQFTFRR